MADQSPFLKSLIGASDQARRQGWPGKFDPLKTVNDTFNSVMSGVGGVERGIGEGVGNIGKSVFDFSNMASRNLGAVQGGLQGLGHQLFGAKPKSLNIPTPPTGSNVGKGYGAFKPAARKSRKAKK
jgi:hypothetical protein